MPQTTNGAQCARALAILIFCVINIAAYPASAPCLAPHFNQGQVWENSGTSVFMSISIPLPDFAPVRLLCLAQSLRQSYADRNSISVLIFSSPDAAARYIPNPPDRELASNPARQRLENPNFWRSQLHGYYSYDATRKEEYVEIRPFGSDVGGDPYDTKIALSQTERPHCALQISGRCLLAAERARYPHAALYGHVAGDVTISGVIPRDGSTSEIQVQRTSNGPMEANGLLVDQAIRTTRTWHFEPQAHITPFLITYSYRIDPALPIPQPYREQVEVKIELPNRVTVTGHAQ